MSDLVIQREALQRNIIDKDEDNTGISKALEAINANPMNATQLIGSWWTAYKAWEKADTFNTAVSEKRMTMRSFGSDFKKQLNKSIPMNIADKDRFYADSDRKKLGSVQQSRHQDAFKDVVNPPAPTAWGWRTSDVRPPTVYANPYRGLDTSLFANPANFQTREEKYKYGLHDLSVKLLIPGDNLAEFGVKEQSHHQAAPNPHFCFLPVSKPEDQYVIYMLIQYAKALKTALPALDTLVRDMRTKMTRVKLSHHYDMGTGYIAVPTPTRPGNLPYKVSFSVGNTVKLRDSESDGGNKKPVAMTIQIVRDRQKAYFKQHASVLKAGNEFVIAMRQHAGPFPVYAYYEQGELKCFDINDGERVDNGLTISALGKANW